MGDHAQGLALICDLEGKIIKVLRNDLELEEAVPKQLFFRLVDNSSRMKAMTFLVDVKSHGSVLDWELDVDGPNDIQTMHFTGNLLEDTLLITAAIDGRHAREIFHDMLRINNEQVNLLRAAIKEQKSAAPITRDEQDFEEISRLNNELVAMQRELAKTNAELARLNELKNQFLGMAAHDLRHPLQGILYYSVFLLEDCAQMSAEQVDFITNIHDQSQYMSSLVDDLLDVATIESGHLQLDRQPLDLFALLNTNLGRHRLIAARKGINIELDAQPVPVLLADRPKMTQVLDNLITNAVKFSPAGSCVRICLRSADGETRLSVCDQGPGISAEEQALLFKPFQRVSVKSTAGEKSSGLGLLIAKRIVSGHGGRIWVDSTPGCGSTFHVALPTLLNPTSQEAER